MRDGLLTLQCAHGTTAHGCTLPAELGAFLVWCGRQLSVHCQQVGCDCSSGQIVVGGGA